MSSDRTDQRGPTTARSASEREKPLVSVVTPTYNRNSLLPDAIDSVLGQTYDNWELIVVDDGSNDDTEELVRSYSDPRIQYVENDGRAGSGGARNTGVRHANGVLLAFLDDDDVWTPPKLEMQVGRMMEEPKIGMVAGRCVFVDDNLEPTGYESPAPEEIRYEDVCVTTSVPGSCSNAIVRREAFEEAGGFDPELLRSEDRDLWIRITRDWRVVCVDGVTAKIRVHSDERRHKKLESILEARKAINRRIPELTLRRKSAAWMWYYLGRQIIQGILGDGSKLRGCAFILRSFLSYPLPLGARHKRVRPFFWELRDKIQGWVQ